MQARRCLTLVLAVLIGVGGVTAACGADVYQVDPSHTSVSFIVTHLAIYKVRGQFHSFTGTISYDADDITRSSLQGSIDVSSINTDHAKRDNDLRGPQFLDAERFPTIGFAGKRVAKDGETQILIGDLTLHGVTKEVMMPFTLTGPLTHLGKTLLGFEATMQINRHEFGIIYNKMTDAGGLIVGNTVHIELSGRAVKQ